MSEAENSDKQAEEVTGWLGIFPGIGLFGPVSVSCPLQDGMVSGNAELVQKMVRRGGQQPMGAWTAVGPGVQSDLSYSRRG